MSRALSQIERARPVLSRDARQRRGFDASTACGGGYPAVQILRRDARQRRGFVAYFLITSREPSQLVAAHFLSLGRKYPLTFLGTQAPSPAPQVAAPSLFLGRKRALPPYGSQPVFLRGTQVPTYVFRHASALSRTPERVRPLQSSIDCQLRMCILIQRLFPLLSFGTWHGTWPGQSLGPLLFRA